MNYLWRYQIDQAPSTCVRTNPVGQEAYGVSIPKCSYRMSDIPESITVTEDGLRLPVIELLTGRGFITGKSGSGKSNTASVVAEELLENGFPLLIVDTDGEYAGLRERYDLLHVGSDDECDFQPEPEEADTVVDLALTENRPVILDVSGIVDGDEVSETVAAFVRSLFVKESDVRKPFLLIVEEMHEFVPEQGGLDELGELLIRVAKRGRKRGLGVCGLSQRPAAVDKDFITQCDWIVWHRLTWKNDTAVVSSVLGSDAAERVSSMDVGEALLMTDWDEELRRVQFRRKRSADIGATPNLDRFDDESLTSARRPGGVEDESTTEDSGKSADSSRVGEHDSQRTNSTGTGGRGYSTPAETKPTTPAGASGTRGAPKSTNSEGDEPEEYDPVWEVAHLGVYLVWAAKRSVWRLIFVVEQYLRRLAGRPGPYRYGEPTRRSPGDHFMLLLAATIVVLLGVTTGLVVAALIGVL